MNFMLNIICHDQCIREPLYLSVKGLLNLDYIQLLQHHYNDVFYGQTIFIFEISLFSTFLYLFQMCFFLIFKKKEKKNKFKLFEHYSFRFAVDTVKMFQ